MIRILASIFIKDKENYSDAKVRRRYGIICSLVGITLNILLFTGKYLAGIISGSIAIMADAFNNLSDAGSSLITLIGFKFSGKKPDIEHPFGHGRIEYISGLAVSAAIMLMGFELAKTSISKIIKPTQVDTGLLSVMILFIAICVKMYMAIYNRTIGKKIDSAAMRATAADSMSDMAATAVVLLSMIIMKYTGCNIDGISGIIVALFILYTGIGAAKDTVSPLLGKSPEPEFVNRIQEIVLGYDEIIGIHDLIVHDYGPGRVMISLHAEVPGDGDIFMLHDVVDQAEDALNRILGCDAVIHMDPIESNNEKVKQVRSDVEGIIQDIDRVLSIHDFRMVEGPTHTNLIFDIVVPFDYSLSDNQIKDCIEEKVKERWNNYNTVIRVDKSFVA